MHLHLDISPTIQRCFYHPLNHRKIAAVYSHRRGVDDGEIASRKLQWRTKKSKQLKWGISSGVGRDSEFEVDPEKARQALDKLDQQLESLSMKQINPPKIQASNLYSNLKEEMKIGQEEISGSFVAFTAFGLFLFTLFYNIIFLTVIKPSIDGPY